MKKLAVLLLTGALALSLVACGEKKDDSNNQTPSTETTEASDTTTDKGEDTNGSNEIISEDPVEILQNAWNLHGEDQMFPVMGGDFSEANNKSGEPGVYDLSDAGAVDISLGLPVASAESVDSAASLMHMMNANTFTCAAFHVAEGSSIDDVVAAIDANIAGRQWTCGFPDKHVIVKVGNVVVSMFGEAEIIDTFKDKLLEAYPASSVEVDKEITLDF